MRGLLLGLWLLSITNAIAARPEAAVLTAGTVLKAEFTQHRHMKGLPKPIRSKGNLLLAEGRGLVWATQVPFPTTLVITKTGLFECDEQNVKTPVAKGADKTVFEVMGQIFSIAPGKEIQGFVLEEQPNQAGRWCLRLTPNHPHVQNFIQSITITGDVYISHISILRPNGDHDEIDIAGQRIQPNMTPETQVYFND